MRVKYKQWAVDYIDQHKENQFDLLSEDKNKISSFVNAHKTYIEIGPGKGEFIISLAKRFPKFNFIVVELNKTVSGICLRAIDEANLKNVKLVSGDFYKFVDQLDKNSIDGIFLNFSDPWPKTKHKNRRLTSDNFLLNYSYILKNNCCIYQKTDNLNLFNYSLEQYKKFNWKIFKKTNNYKREVKFDAMTEFEEKFRLQNILINRVVAIKTKKTLSLEREGD